MRSVLVVLAVAGCYRNPAPQPAAPANKAVVQQSPNTDDELAFLPINADFVVGVDVIRFRDSAIYRAIEPQATAKVGAQLERAHECGLDPLRTLEHIAIAGKGSGSSGHAVFVVRGLDGARTFDCVVRHSGDGGGKAVREGDFLSITDNSGKVVWATFVGTSTIVVEMGPGVTRASLTAVLASGAPLRNSPAFMTLLSRREQGAALWGMVNGSAPVVAELRSLGVSPRSMDGTITVTDRMSAAVRLSFQSKDDADKLAQLAAQQMKGAQAMFERLEVRANGPVVQFDVTATEAQLRMLAGMLGAFGP